jgi:DNA-binding transcriptional MerR regulator
MPIYEIRRYLELYELGNDTISQRKEIIMQHKLKVQNKINEDLKHLEIIVYKAALYDFKEKEINQKNDPK